LRNGGIAADRFESLCPNCYGELLTDARKLDCKIKEQPTTGPSGSSCSRPIIAVLTEQPDKEEIVSCQGIDAYGFDPKDLIGLVPANCQKCEAPVLRPTKATKRAKSFCEACYRKDVAAARMDGAQVDEQEHTQTTFGIKRSQYRTDQ
jgi:hypothetical protein